MVYFNPDPGQPFQKTENIAGKMVKKESCKVQYNGNGGRPRCTIKKRKRNEKKKVISVKVLTWVNFSLNVYMEELKKFLPF